MHNNESDNKDISSKPEIKTSGSESIKEVHEVGKEMIPSVHKNSFHTEMPKTLENHFLHQNRVAHAGKLGAAMGAAYAFLDSKDDGLISTTGKVAAGAALGVAISYGTEFGLEAAGVSSSNLAQAHVKSAAKKVMTEAEELRWQNNMKQKGMVLGRIGIIGIGAATLLDIGSKLSDSAKASKDRNEQEQQLVKKQNSEKKKQKEKSYGYTDYGQITLQQWEKRIGHYMMGNAKFQ